MRRPTTILGTFLAAVVLGACGHEPGEGVVHGLNEGSYLEVGELKYQVQISRQLNPNSAEDRAYLIGVGGDTTLPAGQEWFAVFMRVQNETDRPLRATTDYVIVDTQGNRFRPQRLGDENPFAYRGGVVKAKGLIPEPDSPPAESSIQGSLLLFRVPTRNLENRPLELQIRAPEVPDALATVPLDV